MPSSKCGVTIVKFVYPLGKLYVLPSARDISFPLEDKQIFLQMRNINAENTP